MASSVPYEEEDDFSSDSILEAESDVESNFADSPANGYFTERRHPQDTFVQNPSMTAEADMKARESSEQSARTPSTARPSQPRASSQSWTPVEMPHGRFANADPPPDYEAATSTESGGPRSPNSPTHSSGQANYGSLASPSSPEAITNNNEEMQWPFGNRGNPFQPGFPFGPAGPPLGPFGSWNGGVQPQNMSDPHVTSGNANEETGLLPRGRNRREKRGGRFCRGCMSFCNGILLLAVLCLILLLVGNYVTGSDDTNDQDDDGNVEKKPVMKPTPNMPSKPATPPSSANCPYEHYSATSTFDFPSVQNFSFNEFMESNHLSGGVRGTVAIQPASGKQDVDIRLSVTYALTRPWSVLSTNYIQEDNMFTLQMPDLQGNHQYYEGKPCMWVFVRIEIRPGVSIQTWELNTGNLNIEVYKGLFNDETEDDEGPSVLAVSDNSIFNAVRGSAQIGYWSSRETVIDVIASSITGTFALRDLLSLNSQAGSITVNIDPKKADPDRPRPAELVLTSKVGSIRANLPTSGYIPEREYRTRIEAISSSVQGSYILGSATSIHTESGSIHVDLLPFFDRSVPSNLHTETRAGSTRLNVLTPYDYPGQPWKTPSFHKSVSTSGSINVMYPQEWEGGIDCASLSGSVHVQGKGVEVVRDRKQGPMRYLEARKGDGDGKVELKSTSSSIRMRVGDL